MCIQKANHVWLLISPLTPPPPTIWVIRKKSVNLFINFKNLCSGQISKLLCHSLQNISNFKSEVSFMEYQKSWLMPLNISIYLSYLLYKHVNWRKSYSLVNHKIIILQQAVVPFWKYTLLKLELSVKNPKFHSGCFVRCSSCKNNNHGGTPLPQKKMDFIILGEE